MLTKYVSAFILFFLIGVSVPHVYAQLEEPDVVEVSEPATPLSKGFSNGIGFGVMLNNFGFGVGGYYSKVLGPYSELVFQAGMTGIRDVSEQNFQSYFTGRQIIPNKYKRAFGFPFLLGLKQRLFARHIEDSFRLFIGASAGPSAAFAYPYLNDNDPANGFRDFIIDRFDRLVPRESINDFFSGWSNGEWKWGLNGEIKIGAEIGSSFKTRTTVEFGYFFYYFNEGIQIMEPRKPIDPLDFWQQESTGGPDQIEDSFSIQKYFGTPQIKVTFGGMW